MKQVAPPAFGPLQTRKHHSHLLERIQMAEKEWRPCPGTYVEYEKSRGMFNSTATWAKCNVCGAEFECGAMHGGGACRCVQDKSFFGWKCRRAGRVESVWSNNSAALETKRRTGFLIAWRWESRTKVGLSAFDPGCRKSGAPSMAISDVLSLCGPWQATTLTPARVVLFGSAE